MPKIGWETVGGDPLLPLLMCAEINARFRLGMIVFPLLSSYMCESPILASYRFDRAFQRSFYAYIKYLTAFPRKVTVIKRYWAVITSQHLYKTVAES